MKYYVNPLEEVTITPQLQKKRAQFALNAKKFKH